MKPLLALFAFISLLPAATAANRPNVVLIVTDDGGWADFGFNGCKDYSTPNMDRIANDGVKFTAGYVTGPVCSPSRAGLLTGRYQSRFGHEYNITSGKTQGLPLGEKLVSDRFKQLGYRTAAFGKWHLGGAKGYQPFERGFDVSYGFISGSRGYLGETDAQAKDNEKAWRRNGTPVIEKEYSTDAIARECVGFINQQDKEPFFIYAAFNCPHSPMQAKPGYEEKFSGIADKQRRTLAAMMRSQDEAVGSILSTLKAKGLEDNTLVWLINDNGAGTYWHFDNGPWHGRKGSLFEGGVRVAFAARWPGHIPPALEYRNAVSSLDIAATSLAATGEPLARELDGVDLLPLLKHGSTAKPHETLFWRYLPAAAVLDGEWKLILMDGKPLALYDLSRDPSETRNLAADQPEKCRQLAGKFETWDRANVPPAWRGNDESLANGIRKTHQSGGSGAPEKDLE